VAANPKSLARQLSKRGPHTVLRGDLALAGLPGIVYTPAEGFNLPAVAFGHGWLTGISKYSGLLEHLASWGIVAAAPGTERGPVPSSIGFATDLLTTLDICTGVRLGTGRISVHPHRLALAGHGLGAGAAILGAAQRRVAAVAALYPAPTTPSAAQAAARVEAPGLVLVGEKSFGSMNSDAVSVAQKWGGEDVQLRVVDDADDQGLVEGRRLLGALGFGGAERKTQERTRSLLTGFLLHRLTGDKTYAAFADPANEVPGSTVISDPSLVEQDLGSRINTLLSR
jgi:pimeloyl-ACP methyl ester carboxylesterase